MALQFPDFDPVALPIPALHLGSLTLGPFPVRWYALAYIAGILLGWRYCVALIRNGRLWGGKPATATATQIDDLVLWVTLAIILGGRIGYICFYMLVSPDQRAQLALHPAEVFEIWKGGMSFHGAAIGVGLAIIGFARANRLSLLGLLDLVAACEPIGQCFGRLANFINGELWGRPTSLPWGMIFCNRHIAAENGGACPPEVMTARHPSQLYEAVLEGLVLFAVLTALIRAGALKRPGLILGAFALGYGVARSIGEHFREPDPQLGFLWGGLTMGTLLSIPLMLAGVALIAAALRREPARRT